MNQLITLISSSVVKKYSEDDSSDKILIIAATVLVLSLIACCFQKQKIDISYMPPPDRTPPPTPKPVPPVRDVSADAAIRARFGGKEIVLVASERNDGSEGKYCLDSLNSLLTNSGANVIHASAVKTSELRTIPMAYARLQHDYVIVIELSAMFISESDRTYPDRSSPGSYIISQDYYRMNGSVSVWRRQNRNYQRWYRYDGTELQGVDYCVYALALMRQAATHSAPAPSQ